MPDRPPQEYIRGDDRPAAGISVALQTDHPVIPVQYLPLAGAYAIKAGMDPDIAIFTGHPFDPMTETVATVVAGEVVYRNPKFA